MIRRCSMAEKKGRYCPAVVQLWLEYLGCSKDGEDRKDTHGTCMGQGRWRRSKHAEPIGDCRVSSVLSSN
jgi:hypothetical protein